MPVEEPMRTGTYWSVCGNCHIRGHRADGNHNNDACIEKKNLIAFQSKSILAFATAITPRLNRAFSEKYSLKDIGNENFYCLF